MHIKLIRHGESEANTGLFNPTRVKDAAIALSSRGIEQALNAGNIIGEHFLQDALIYCSPYQRTRQTLEQLLKITDSPTTSIYEDPRLREIDVGYGDATRQMPLRQLHGWFYYRFDGGESPADCYDRTSSFLESMMRQVERSRKSNILLVCHGMTLRCFVARFLRLTVEEFEDMHNPDNCEIITIGLKDTLEKPVFKRGRWAVEGIRLRSQS
ncbi:MAG TPA: histidine phosphatase family protein [Gammaproteobacteria bacterium]|nr:histidine phosphatase family protein [Gammaproteobacteria bacterium]